MPSVLSTSTNIVDLSPADRKEKPRLLFLAHRMPFPPEKGDKIRTYREWKALTETHRVTLAFFLDDPADAAHLPALRKEFEEVIAVRLNPRRGWLRTVAALPGRQALSLAFYRSREMRRRLRDLRRRRQFDAVFAFSSTMAPYALSVPAPRRVLDLCDLDSQKWGHYGRVSGFPMSWIYRTESRRLGEYEASVARKFDLTMLVSAPEAQDLLRSAPGARVVVAGNGVDLDYFDPSHFPEVRGDAHTTVFCGAMDYRSNIDAVLWYTSHILPLIRRRLPDTRLLIVGSKPSQEILRLSRKPGIEVTGRVADVRPDLLRAAVSVAPMRLSRGVPNKILEALALGLPVVTTSVASAGLRMSEFAGADIADDAQGFADMVIRRLQEAQRGDGRFLGNRATLGRLYPWGDLSVAVQQATSPARVRGAGTEGA